MNIVIPAAGAGSRFKQISNIPKPYISVDNMPMVALAAKTLNIKDAIFHYILPVHEKLPLTKEYLSSISPNCYFYDIDYITEGAVQSALITKSRINNDDELIIANCDQVMNWDPVPIIEEMRKYDAGIITIKSNDHKHSYAEIDEGKVKRIVEKQPISDFALTGIHYWKKGRYFVNSGENMIQLKDKTLNEFYISNTYNYLIKDNFSVGHYQITPEEISFIGTPVDLQSYNDSSVWQTR